MVDDLQKLAAAEKTALGAPTETTPKDAPTKTAALDRKLIDIDQAHEVRHWTYILGCTEEELRRAVSDVGNSAQEVRAYFGHRGDLPLPQPLWD